MISLLHHHYIIITSFSPAKQEKKKKKVKSSGGVVKREAGGVVGGGVNEQKVDLLLDMLKSADVTDTSYEESETVKQLESEFCAACGKCLY